MVEAGFDQPEAQQGCPIANTYSEKEVKEFLGGFDVLSIDQRHIFFYQVEPYKKGQYIKQPWFESMPVKMVNSLSKNSDGLY